jgi:ferredoxin-NADP reductase
MGIVSPAVRGRLTWRVSTVTSVRDETPTARTIALKIPGWPGHRAGQHVDVRLTAADGYSAQRSYSIASAPDGDQIELTVQRRLARPARHQLPPAGTARPALTAAPLACHANSQ